MHLGGAAERGSDLSLSDSISAKPLRANITETLLVLLIKEQGGKEIQHEEREGILSGPGCSAQ